MSKKIEKPKPRVTIEVMKGDEHPEEWVKPDKKLSRFAFIISTPDGFREPKPNDRLLSLEEMFEATYGYKPSEESIEAGLENVLSASSKAIAKAQLAKAMEWEAKTCANCAIFQEMDSKIQKAVDKVNLECQARIEEIVSEVEDEFFTFTGDGNLILKSAINRDRAVAWWQALKASKGVK